MGNLFQIIAVRIYNKQRVFQALLAQPGTVGILGRIHG